MTTQEFNTLTEEQQRDYILNSLYAVVDGRTGRVVSKPMKFLAAKRSSDKRDQAFGGVRFHTQIVN
jgi:hypothetical protein